MSSYDLKDGQDYIPYYQLVIEYNNYLDYGIDADVYKAMDNGFEVWLVDCIKNGDFMVFSDVSLVRRD
jgi:hypothetical protein